VIELYHHTVRAGQYDEARTLFRDRINRATYYQFGAYQLQTELLRTLFPDGEDQPPRLKDESAQAWTLNELANSYSLSGQSRQAVPLFEQHNAICEKRGDKHNLAVGLGNLATQQMVIGALHAAEANLRRSIALCREIEDEFNEAIGHQELGRLLAYRGKWDEAEEELAASTHYWEQTNDVQGLCMDEAYRALRALLLARAVGAQPVKPPEGSQPSGGYCEIALAAARRALELADETARTILPSERDYVRAHWLVGAAHRANGDFTKADRHLSEALTRCRSINMVDHEADILLDLARLRAATGPFGYAQGRSFDSAQDGREEALRLAQEALLITERCGYVLQGADVHLFLAQMALEDEDEETALEHAREARRLAACDGPPDYTYRVAYDEAGVLLQRIESG
jgi:tetratricopeptide (TPR) repeat protein